MTGEERLHCLAEFGTGEAVVSRAETEKIKNEFCLSLHSWIFPLGLFGSLQLIFYIKKTRVIRMRVR